MSAIIEIGPGFADYIAESQAMYPEEMREDAESFRAILNSTLFSFGYFAKGLPNPLGWVLCSAEEPKSAVQVYWYDVAVLPEYQGKGIAKALMKHAYAELRWHDQWIRMHTRRATYPRSEEGLRRMGYRIVRDIYLPHHYLQEYGIDEDAHELLLAPA